MEASMARSETCRLSNMVEKLSTRILLLAASVEIATRAQGAHTERTHGRSVTDRLQAAAAGDACLARTQIRARARTIDNRCQSRDASS